jgi:RNA polymerase sigma-70 factor (ECF subfamily)
MMTLMASTPSGDQIDWVTGLIQRARKGDQHAFERLYREFSGRVYGLCLRMTRDPANAEDCAQEAFINAWRALDRFEIRSSFSTWLHRIAVNVVLSKRRRVSFHAESPLESEELEQSEWSLDTPVEESEIEAAIAGLPEGARDVLVLSGIYGYSHGETAQMLGVAEGTCKAQLHRARKLLQERLSMELN